MISTDQDNIVFKYFDTGGRPVFGYHEYLECDCGLTGGCPKCNPFKEFWKEDVRMAEKRIDEYNEILLNEDKEK